MIFESNLALHRNLNLPLAAKLLEVNEDELDLVEVNGTGIFQLTDDEGTPFYSASVVNPQFEAELFLQTINPDNKGYVLLGVPSLTFLEQLLNRINNAAWLIIVEKDLRVIKHCMKYIPLKNWLREGMCKILFVSGELREIHTKFRHILDTHEGLYMLRPEVIRTYPSMRAHAEFYREVNVAIFEQIRNKCQASGNQLESTLKGIKQELENLPHIVNMPRIKDLKDRFAGKPMICVASGPSLDKQLPMLKQLQGKVMILAAVSAFRVLVNNGIEPDIVSVLERGPEAIDQCFNDTPIPKKTWLFVLSLCDPRLYTFWPNPVVPCFKQNLYLHWFTSHAIGDFGTVPSSKSVAHMNVMLAHHFGAEPIVLIGQDLAYADSGRTHSVHTHYEINAREQADSAKSVDSKPAPVAGTRPPIVEKEVGYLDEEVWVNGYYGGKVRSKRVWLNFLTSMENIVSLIKRPVINATEGGAEIRGAIQQPFKDVFEKYQNETFTPLVDFQNELYNNTKSTENRIVGAWHKFREMMDEMNELLAEFDNWLKSTDEFVKSLEAYEPETERYLLRQARTHALYFDILLEKFKANRYMMAFFIPVTTMHFVCTNPISRITDIQRSKELFQYYRYFCDLVTNGGKKLTKTIEEQFALILPEAFAGSPESVSQSEK